MVTEIQYNAPDSIGVEETNGVVGCDNNSDNNSVSVSSSSNKTKRRLSAPEIMLNEIYNTTVTAIANEMPLLMHGSGDVLPNDVDPGTVQLLSALTVQYISRFVDAAIDSREMLLDHQHIYYPKRKKINTRKRKLQQQQNNNNSNSNDTNTNNTSGNNNSSTTTSGNTTQGHQGLDTNLYTRMKRPDPPLPPPSFYRSRQPPIPPPPVDDDKNLLNNNHNSTNNNNNTKGTIPRYLQEAATNHSNKKQKKLPNIDYWDDPLPEPKIRNKHATTNAVGGANTTTTTTSSSNSISANVHVDEWVGVAGVDLFEHRCRAAYVHGTAAITTQSFIFPICHDVYTYGRIRELQTSKRTTFNSGSIIQDTVLLDLIRTEGRKFLKLKRKNNKKKNKKKKMNKNNNKKNRKGKSKSNTNDGGTSDPDDDDDDDNDDSDDDDDDDDSDNSDMSMVSGNGGVGANDEDGPIWPGLDDILPVYHNTDDFVMYGTTTSNDLVDNDNTNTPF